MLLEDFERIVSTETPLSVTYPVYRPPPGGAEPIPIAVMLAEQVPSTETRTVTYRHILGKPTQAATIQAWRKRWPNHNLPDDLVALVQRFNGIHLWADDETGRSYWGLAPLEEWMPARHAMYGPDSDPSLLADRYLAISYHADAGAYAVLDVSDGEYFLMDTAGPDRSSPIGSTADDLLDWLWQGRVPPVGSTD